MFNVETHFLSKWMAFQYLKLEKTLSITFCIHHILLKFKISIFLLKFKIIWTRIGQVIRLQNDINFSFKIYDDFEENWSSY